MSMRSARCLCPMARNVPSSMAMRGGYGFEQLRDSTTWQRPMNSQDPTGAFTTAEIDRWRSEFPILETCTYLVSHSLGAMPRRAVASVQAFADTWMTRGVRAWSEGWREMGRTVGD